MCYNLSDMRVSELGEFGLIELLAGIVDKARIPESASWQELLVGVGDDAAAWHGDSCIQLGTTDTLVEGVHFDLNVIKWQELGWKAIAVNLSDIAAMGGIPKYALVSLALPAALEIDCVASLYQGMIQVANEFGLVIAGGNLARADKSVITVTIVGSMANAFPLTRSAAAPGDQIAVTGYVGLSAAGLQMLAKSLEVDGETARLLRQAHLQPMPRIKEGQILLQEGVRAAIDISDGLVADLAHICTASQVSGKIESKLLPIHPAVEAYFQTDREELGLAGGEDYELVFAAPGQVMSRVQQALSCPVTVIGEITEGAVGQVAVLNASGQAIPWQKAGWDHFKSGS